MKVIFWFLLCVFSRISAAKLELQQRRQQSKPANSRGSRFTDIPQDPKSFLADEERDDIPLEKTKPERKPQNGEKRDKKQQPMPNGQQSTPQVGRQIVGRRAPGMSPSDFKSVRLSQLPLIGSGRVGPRQITKTQFQGIEPEIDSHNDVGPRSGHSEKSPFNKEQKRNINSNNNNFRQQKSSPQSSTHKNQSGKQFSVQDRLKLAQTCNTERNLSAKFESF